MTIDRDPLARDEEPFVMATLVPAHLPAPRGARDSGRRGDSAAPVDDR
jgi:hypothetical protein